MSEAKRKLPVIALRGMAVLPGMLIHFDITRKITIEAIEHAMLSNQMIMVVAQRDETIDSPEKDDLYSVGIIAEIKQIIRLSDKVLRVMISAKKRAVLKDIIQEEPFLICQLEEIEEIGFENLKEIEITAMIRALKELYEVYAQDNTKVGGASLQNILAQKEPTKLVDDIAMSLPLDLEEKQRILEEFHLYDRYCRVSLILSQEIEIFRIKSEFEVKVKERVDKNQKDYLLREQLKVIQEELGENNTLTDAEDFLERLQKIKASKEVKKKIKDEIKRFKNVSVNSSESAVVRGYIETLLDMPWNKSSQDNPDIKNAEKILDQDHYGMEKVKERILEFLAVRSLTGKGQAPIVCLLGPPGTGKTSIARSVAQALDKKYVRISLGGIRDEAEIRGHRKTYVGAMPGRIVMGIKNAGVKNPLILLDEIDKVSSDYKGDTSSALLEVLDSEQNHKFRDHYIELPVDLSDAMFLCTANNIQTIPKPLLDRMELIEVSSYTENEKYHIARKHLVEKQKAKNGLEKNQLTISVKALKSVILNYTREAGVRNLERKIGQICRKAAREIITEEKKQVKITEKNLEKYLGKIKYTIDKANEEDEVGIVRGLAWTTVGGATLQIEVNVMPGKGVIELTGQLGDVMKESAKAGISYIRSISEEYHISETFFQKNDIHIHIPEGAVQKDGPSAGITMATAILSAISGIKVDASLAMTGEITLRGKVLPVGGLKEKILAAKNAKIKSVLVPRKNENAISEIPSEILEGIDVHFVETMKEVFEYALVKE